jgi:hypothetical protein
MKKLILGALLIAPAAWGQVASLDDQAKCANQAEKVFRGREAQIKSQDPDADPSFTSHYNPKLGSCFVDIFEGPDPLVEFRDYVMNAFEGTEVASLTFMPDPKNVPEVKILHCEVRGTDCRSRKEFYDQLAMQLGIE